MTIELPDFDDLQKRIEKIGSLASIKLGLEIEIKKAVANVTFKVTTDEKYFIGGKPPSSAYIDKTYEILGLDGEIAVLREQLAQATAELEYARLYYDLQKSKIDVWRTQVANERASLMA